MTMNKKWLNTSQRDEIGDRLTGEFGEHVLDLVKNYKEARLLYNLSDNQQLRYFHKLFDEETRRFYQDMVRSKCESYRLAKAVVTAHCSTANRQNRVKRRL